MRATIGITTGDPAGIGLEVILKSIQAVLSSARWILFTGRSVFERHLDIAGPRPDHRWISSLEEVTDDALLFLSETPDCAGFCWGQVQPEAGRRALDSLNAASDAALQGRLDAIVTGPVSKEAIGADFIGQTEFLAAAAGCERFAMAFFTPTFKVALATTHVPLREALERISTAGYVDLIRLVDSELRRLRFDGRRIAVAAVNPHAGEGGMFGLEDIDTLAPAVARCAKEGIAVSGPHSADSVYFRAHTGEFDVVIAPYHDQGLIPVKLIAHGAAVNVTLGLPYVRTSPDHGTAFAIAGKGAADPSGMEAALRTAVELTARAQGAHT